MGANKAVFLSLELTIVITNYYICVTTFDAIVTLLNQWSEEQHFALTLTSDWR